jgi:hypothetical protein
MQSPLMLINLAGIAKNPDVPWGQEMMTIDILS